MINPVETIKNQKTTMRAKSGEFKTKLPNHPALDYADRFVKHSVESLPVLTGMALLWSIVDKGNGIPFKKAFLNNAKNIILPVMVVTSAITSFIETGNNKTK